MQRGSSVIHWFQAGYRGLVVSLCHTAKEHPRFITPPQPGEGTACRSCLKVIAAHGTDRCVFVSIVLVQDDRRCADRGGQSKKSGKGRDGFHSGKLQSGERS